MLDAALAGESSGASAGASGKDAGAAGTDPADGTVQPLQDLPNVDELINGIEYYKNIAEKLNLKFIVGTLLPIYNWRTYAPFREDLKNAFNTKLKNGYRFIDFEAEIGYEKKGIWYFKEGCDSGDHLHPSEHAYKLMGILAANKIINNN